MAIASTSPDILIVGSGIGGATLAAGLAPSGARDRHPRARRAARRHAADARHRGDLRATGISGPEETWLDAGGPALQSRQLLLCRRQLEVLRRGHAALPRARTSRRSSMPRAGSRPPGPSPMPSSSPGTPAAEQLFEVRGALGQDPTEPPALRALSARARARTRRPSPRVARAAGGGRAAALLAAARRRHRALARPRAARRGTPIPTPAPASSTPRPRRSPARCAIPNVSLVTGTRALRLLMAPDGRRVEGVEVEQGGERQRAARRHRRARGGRGELRRAAAGLGEWRQPGWRRQPLRRGRPALHEPQFTAMLAVDPRLPNRSVYQKTLGINDFYLDDGKGGPPLGNVQLLGKITAPILKANMRWAPDARARRARRLQLRLVPDERGPARSRQPRPARRRRASSCTGGAPT